MSPERALRTPYYRITVVPGAAPDDKGYLRLDRTEERYPDVESIHGDRRAILALLEPHLGLPILCDLRGGPVPPSDPAFEQALARAGQELYARFRRVAVLVRSSVGSLQVRRVARSVDVHVDIFSDENEALAFLQGR